jgi:hypothetical protein
MLYRWDIINYYMQRQHRKDYLEIGCAYNDTFNKIKATTKVGVDPNSGGTLRMTSDEFFKVNLINFDIIFIDGLHEHEQVVRDFNNARKFLRKGGYIFLHDLLPPGPEYAIFPATEKDPTPRCGTTWRVIFDILKLNKEFYIINRETGIGVWRDRPQEHKQYSRDITYEQFEEIKKDLRIIGTSEALLIK